MLETFFKTTFKYNRIELKMCKIDEVSHSLVLIKQIKREFLTEAEEKMFWEGGMEVEVLDS